MGYHRLREHVKNSIELKSDHIFYYKGQKDKKEHGVDFLVNTERAGNIENIYSLSEQIAGE